MNELINDLVSMIGEINVDYKMFKFNPTQKLIQEKITSEISYSNNINFPIKSEEEFIVYLNCIINNKRIKNPARTKYCKHIECIEVVNLFKYVLEYGNCPICNEYSLDTSNNVTVDTIYIDKFFKDILTLTLDTAENNNSKIQFDMIILNKNNKKWIPHSFGYCKNEEINIKEKHSYTQELIDMNKYINEEENSIELSELMKLFSNAYYK
jgi:hypothetical protein